MNKYNIGDTVYYANEAGIQKTRISVIGEMISDGWGRLYQTEDSTLFWRREVCVYPTADELIEWLKTTIKE